MVLNQVGWGLEKGGRQIWSDELAISSLVGRRKRENKVATAKRESSLGGENLEEVRVGPRRNSLQRGVSAQSLGECYPTELLG